MRCSPPLILETPHLRAARALAALLLGIREGHAGLEADIRRAGRRLHALPLPPDEWALARSRLRNARCYLRAGERGAARFEIRLLRPLAAGN